uniref:Inositol-tetrakisphosphate 1-kinase n=1 Tax=Macrostomum lignano TaxID=282301 RepID=A0A1I8I9R3_9PLAT
SAEVASSAAADRPPIEVAVLLSDEKERKLRLFERCRQNPPSGVRFHRLDLDELLQSGSRYRVVLHKIHSELTSNKPESIDRVRRFKAWIEARGSELVLLDPLRGLESMLLARPCPGNPGDPVADSNGALRFPLLCKPHLASGAEAHSMSLVFNAGQLADLRPPLVAQEFVNHGARIIKVYVLGSRIHACIRPSVRDFQADHAGPAIQFSSHAVSKAGCQSELSDAAASAQNGDDGEMLLSRYSGLLEPLCRACRSVLGLDLLNLDLVPDTRSGRLGLVDINQFPGFESMPNYVDALVELIKLKVNY